MRILCLRLSHFIILTLIVSDGLCQGPTSHWYFGDSAGIKFENYTPSFLLNSNLGVADEGSAVLSNRNGDLLNYARPSFILNQLHDTIENGSNLEGNNSSTQGAIFIPNPIDTSIVYFISHQYELGQDTGHHFSIVRKTNTFPLGIILPTEKNVPLVNGTTEKTTAVHHNNGSDIWVITRKVNTDSMLAILITHEGVQGEPIVSIVPNDGNLAISGQLKSSPNGKFLAECIFRAPDVYPIQARVYKFNNVTGEVTESISISYENTLNTARPYGCEFSANSKFLYFANTFTPTIGPSIFQYSIENYDSSSINSSRFDLFTNQNFALQIGVDKKIYGAKLQNQYLSCISNPQTTGATLLYSDSAVYLGGRTSRLGLPDFIQSYFHPAYFDYESKCNLPVKFTSYPVGQDSVHWDFGESSSASNASTLINPAHDYQNEGFYTVEFIVYADSSSDTFSRDIYVKKSLGLTGSSFSADICDTAHVINANHNLTLMKYNWSTGAAADSISVTQSGTYFCSMTAFCDSLIDTFQVSFIVNPEIDLGNDTVLCEGDTLTFMAENLPQTNYQWSTGENSTAVNIDASIFSNLKPIDLWLTSTNACGNSSDTIRIDFLPQPDVSWFSDSILCNQSEAIVNTPSIDSVTFFMTYTSDDIAYDTLTPPWVIDTFGLYYAHAFNKCDTVVKRAFLSPFNVIDVSLGADTVLCPGDSIVLNAFWPASSYAWSNGSLDSVLVVSYDDLQSNGSETYTVTITNGACDFIAARKLSVDDLICDTANCKFSIPNVFSPNADGINDVLKISNTCSSLPYAATIYNRWGQLIFADERGQGNLPLSWDGYINGIAASQGTYFIIIQYDEGKVQKGSFSLVR